MSERKPIGHVVATVRIPPGITDEGTVGVCRREVELVHQQYVEVDGSVYEPLRDSLKGLPQTWYPDLLMTVLFSVGISHGVEAPRGR